LEPLTREWARTKHLFWGLTWQTNVEKKFFNYTGQGDRKWENKKAENKKQEKPSCRKIPKTCNTPRRALKFDIKEGGLHLDL